MTTSHYLAFLVNGVRQELADEDPVNYRWTEQELISHLQKAMQELSKVAPYEKKSTLTTAASRDLSITSLVPRVLSYWQRGVQRVEYQAERCNFEVWDNTLTLDFTPTAGKDINIWWAQFHEVTTTSTTLTAELENIVVDGACAYALMAWGTAHLPDINAGGPMTPSQMRDTGLAKLGLFRQARDRLRRIQKYEEL